MSIRTEWINRVCEERLFRLGFLIPGPPEKRTVLMSAEINNLVSGPWEHSEMGERCARLRADLEYVLAGEPLTVCLEPGKGRKYHQIGLLDPPQDFMFDLRSVEKPSLRVTLHFAEKDVLIAFLCAPRSRRVSWLHRLPLLDFRSKEWRKAIMETHALWGELFPNHRPHSGDNVRDFLSNAIVR
jgi:hypothetical protein